MNGPGEMLRGGGHAENRQTRTFIGMIHIPHYLPCQWHNPTALCLDISYKVLLVSKRVLFKLPPRCVCAVCVIGRWGGIYQDLPSWVISEVCSVSLSVEWRETFIQQPTSLVREFKCLWILLGMYPRSSEHKTLSNVFHRRARLTLVGSILPLFL